MSGSEKFEVALERLQSGWVTFRIRAGQQQLDVRASSATDPLGELLRGLALLGARSGSFEVDLTREGPEGGYLLKLCRAESSFELTAKRCFDDETLEGRAAGRQSRVRLRWRGSFDAAVAAFVTAFETVFVPLGRVAYEQAWGRDFPAESYQALASRRVAE